MPKACPRCGTPRAPSARGTGRRPSRRPRISSSSPRSGAIIPAASADWKREDPMSATTMLADLAGGTERRSPTYQVLVDDIKALGVEQVFGLMSDDTAVFATALDSSGIRFYGARHENNAIAMAEGFSYSTAGLRAAGT